MKGLDTNVLLRYVTADDPAQTPRARGVLERAEAEGERCHVSVIVLCELVWNLRGQRYGYSRTEIAEVLEALLETSLFQVQSKDLVRHAVRQYRESSGDFADYLIGQLDRQAGYPETWTFDENLHPTPGFVAPP